MVHLPAKKVRNVKVNKYNISLCCMVRNERPENLEEFKNYHQNLGVEHIYFLEHSPNSIPIPSMSDVTIWQLGSGPCQRHAYAEHVPNIPANWVAIIDSDEFIVCDNLTSLLNTDAEAVGLNWLVFGSSGIEDFITPIHGSFHWRTDTNNPVNRHIKSIVRPHLITRVPGNPHYFDIRTVNELGLPIGGAFSPYSAKIARLNHYVLRSKADYIAKMQRGRADCYGGYDWSLFNIVNEESIIFDSNPTSL